MFRKNTKLKQENIHIVFNDGGLGDHICRCSALQFIIDNYPNVKLTIWCHSYFIELGKLLVPNATWKHPNEQTEEDKLIPKTTIFAGGQSHTSMGTHLVDHAFHVIVDKQVKSSDKNYIQPDIEHIDISKFNLPEKYIVITCGHTVKVRELTPKVINQIANYVSLSGYIPVFLGSEKPVTEGTEVVKGNFSTEVNYKIGINLINQTTLPEALKIISKSKCIVGLDNGLLHLAGCTQVPIVFGFTTVKPEHRLPYRKNELGWNCYPVVPPESLECRFCQSEMNFVYDHDFRNCFYNDLKCVKDTKAFNYISQIEKIIKEEK